MQIGSLEINWVKKNRSTPLVRLDPSPIDRTGVFAVPNDEPWWLAVNETIDEAEVETMRSARRSTLHPYGCIAAVAAGEGCDLVRQKLIDKRNIALEEVRGYAKGNTSPQGL